ncbi:MAG: type III polyketide synthase [Angustibacter sp.]
MSRIIAVQPVLPEHQYPQEQLTAAFAELCLGENTPPQALARFHANCGVETRHLALPLDEYRKITDFTAANNAFIEIATELGCRAVAGALETTGLTAQDIDLVLFTSVTGLAVPSIDARVARRLGMRPDVRRVPQFGLGCMAGAAGLAQLHDYLLGHPEHIAVLLSVELCSLTVQRNDRSVANLIASGLFGDGATAVIAAGAERRPPASTCWSGPQLIDSRSQIYPNTADAMGWDITDTGFTIVLGAQVPDLVRTNLRGNIDDFLARHRVTRADITGWVCHPGGPKVIEAMRESLNLAEHELALTRQSLARIGNLSSSSVLHVLADTLRQRSHPPGTPGVLLAFGPGFAGQFVLLRW